MTTATYNQSPAGSLRHYLKDVSIAARAFAEALFAAQGRQFVAQEVRTAKIVSERDKAKGRRQLFSLANQYERYSPNLSAELRSIAARD
jgi:predicted HNH restriction endonuclease